MHFERDGKPVPGQSCDIGEAYQDSQLCEDTFQALKEADSAGAVRPVDDGFLACAAMAVAAVCVVLWVGTNQGVAALTEHPWLACLSLVSAALAAVLAACELEKGRGQ